MVTLFQAPLQSHSKVGFHQVEQINGTEHINSSLQVSAQPEDYVNLRENRLLISFAFVMQSWEQMNSS